MRKFQEIRSGPVSAAARDLDRCARLPLFPGIEADARSVLAALRVLVVGSGSVGFNVVLHLARLAIGTLWIVDPGRLKKESLLTHPVLPSQVGESKAVSAGRIAKALSPASRVFVFDGPVEALPLAALPADIACMAVDNLAAEVELGTRCLNRRVRLLHVALHGSTLCVQLRSFANRGAGDPCPACAFNELELAELDSGGGGYGCEGDAPPEGSRGDPGQATVSFSSLCSLAADLLLVQLLRQVLGLGQTLENQMLEYAGFLDRLTVTPLLANPDCPIEHLAWSRRLAPKELPHSSLHELVTAAGFDLDRDLARLSVMVDGLVFVERGACACRQNVAVQRFRAPHRSLASCRRCRQPVEAHPFFSHQSVPLGRLAGLVRRPLGSLGAAGAQAVLIRCGAEAVLLQRSLGHEEWRCA
ncbi:MAG: ThiF family adenylyltransferase [Planctomycetota bacterium]